jgi:hypothetical protein
LCVKPDCSGLWADGTDGTDGEVMELLSGAAGGTASLPLPAVVKATFDS